ncbi:MAG TPA: hypothetical protein VMM78_01225 [Thermomicrobiales bacterium]|nr:hypothetical protein [Thermomicrobiales bacterium]
MEAPQTTSAPHEDTAAASASENGTVAASVIIETSVEVVTVVNAIVRTEPGAND